MQIIDDDDENTFSRGSRFGASVFIDRVNNFINYANSILILIINNSTIEWEYFTYLCIILNGDHVYYFILRVE